MNETKRIIGGNTEITPKDKRLANLKPPWSKGVSGNPGGRPKNIINLDELLEAINEVGEEKGKGLLKKCVEMAYTNPQIMIALISKFIPTQTKTEAEVKYSYTEPDVNNRIAELLSEMAIAEKEPIIIDTRGFKDTN
jgi:hypothetical protein